MSEPRSIIITGGPTSEECSCHSPVIVEGKRGFAVWYPQMGGYVGRAVVLDAASVPPGCFLALVWHDGDFPFGDKEPARLHHCMAEQFVRFGKTVDALLFGVYAQ